MGRVHHRHAALRRAFIVSTAAMALAAPVSAQEGLALEEIIVTAQKRAEKLQEVPVSVTAFSAATIEDAGIKTAEDFLALTPNIRMVQSFTVGNSFVTVRGISQINNNDPSVAVVVDGVPQSNQKQLAQQFFDIERIEVLKGPQGALYGRNSIGGAINIITRQPKDRMEGSAEIGYGSGDTWSATAAVGGPVVQDKLLFRAAASYQDSDGLITNTFLDRKADFFQDKTGRLQATWMATENLSVDARASVSRTEGGAVLYSQFGTTGLSNATYIKPQENVLGESQRDMDDLSLKIDWNLGAATLTAITAYSSVKESYRGDLDFSSAQVVGQGQDLDVSMLSQELRLTSPNDQPFRWIAGAYYLHTERDLTTTVFADTNSTIAGFAPLFVFGDESNDNDAYALFGQGAFDVTEKLELSGALRLDSDQREQTDLLRNNAVRERTFRKWQPKVTAKYKWTDAVMTYATFSTGFRSGGFNAPTVNPAIFAKETTSNYEAGFKATMADGRLVLNGSAFHTKLRNAQIFKVDLTAGAQIIDNVRRANLTGLELEAQARLAKGWDLFGGVGLTDSDIKDFDGSAAYRGNQLPSNTKLTLNAGSQYSFDITDQMEGLLRIDVDHRGKQYYHADNIDYRRAVTLIDLRAGLNYQGWSLTAYVKNLTDKQYFSEYTDAYWSGSATGQDLGQLSRPRTYGVNAKVRF
ncbi:TonB-dependent receptor [Niveispirillum sp.]|uniref:TonB-dependent receptor n=1 Tax=Niveispirillum sp. TaxID=1917217 RepID=UPI001B5DD9ED|nr:TonB-dependent receptor [Niveispirillum sp.]MBP7336944.1 TonB-dependent receptor [Niveispirillum sp.]